MLAESNKYKNVPSKRRRSTSAKKKLWADSQKIEAVQTFLLLGSISMVSATLKIPEQTLYTWKNSTWWKEIVEEIQLQEDIQLSTKLKRIVEKALDQAEDRVTNGDYIYDTKIGSLVRKPVALKDLNRTTMDMLAKKDQLLGKQTPQVSVEQFNDKLLKLAEKFANIAKGVPEQTSIQVTDVIFSNNGDSDAVHD